MLKNKRHRMLLDENSDWAWGTSETTETSDTSKDESGKTEEGKKDTTTSIPKARFDEVNERMKKAEAEVAKYKEAEQKKAEADALAKWEHEKIIAQRDQEIAELKKEQALWKEREDLLSSRNTERVETLKKNLWEGWKDAESLISDINDPFKLSSKLDSLEKIYGSRKASTTSWGSDMPSWWKSDGRLAELQDRANKGEHLSIWEQAELLKLARWKRDE